MVDIGAEHKLVVVVGIQVVTVVIVVVVGILVVVVEVDILVVVVEVNILVVVVEVGILVVVVGILLVVVATGILIVADIQFGVVVVDMMVADHKVVGSLEEFAVLEKVVDFLEDIDSNFHVDDVHVHIHVHVHGIHHVDQKLDIHLVVGSNFVAVVDHED